MRRYFSSNVHIYGHSIAINNKPSYFRVVARSPFVFVIITCVLLWRHIHASVCVRSGMRVHEYAFHIFSCHIVIKFIIRAMNNNENPWSVAIEYDTPSIRSDTTHLRGRPTTAIIIRLVNVIATTPQFLQRRATCIRRWHKKSRSPYSRWACPRAHGRLGSLDHDRLISFAVIYEYNKLKSI